MPTREEDAWETAQIFMNAFNVDQDQQYHGMAAFNNAKLMSVTLPPPPPRFASASSSANEGEDSSESNFLSSFAATSAASPSVPPNLTPYHPQRAPVYPNPSAQYPELPSLFRNPGPIDSSPSLTPYFPQKPPAASSLSTPNVTVTIRITIPHEFNNRVGNLHGGAAATIFDNLNSVALSVWANHCAPTEDLAMRWQTTGVSRILNVSYLRPVKVGDEVDVLNEVVSVGKNLALVKSSMVKVKDGKISNTCEHHKVSIFGGEKL